MLKKLVLAALAAGPLMIGADVALAASMETTIWTIKCSTASPTRKVKVTAEDRMTARDMVQKEAASSGFCAQAYNVEVLKVEEVK